MRIREKSCNPLWNGRKWHHKMQKSSLDEAVDVREESGRIVIEPAQPKEYDLAELVKGITRENLHDEADFGRPVGKEAL